MLTITVEVRDLDGQVIDPAAVGVDSLVTMMRARPPGHPPDPLDGPRAVLESIERVVDHTPRQLERYLQRLLAQLDPALVKRRRAQAQSDRWVWISHRDDGTSDLAARLRTEEAEAIHAALRAVALRGRMPCCPEGDESSANSASTGRLEDARTFDQRMADALVDLILPLPSGDVVSPAAPAKGVQAHVSTQLNVTIPVDSLAGLSDSPGTVSGYGVIPADLARRLAGGDARWRTVLVQRATGAVLDVSPWAYRPRAALDRHVRLRDATCRFPGCSVPAAECDLDHLVPFPTGPTTAQNLHALCRHHHRMKHESGWTVQALADNGLRWTSPSGTVAETWPESYAVAPPDNWVA